MTATRKPDQFNLGAVPNIDQIKTGMASYFQFLRDNAAKAPWAGADHMIKMVEYAEANMTATLEFAEEMTHVRTFEDFSRVQSAFVEKQMKAFGEQAQALAQSGMKAATNLFNFRG